MSGGGGKNTIEKADPWEGQQPYLENLYAQAGALPEQQYYPESTVVPQSPETLQALQMQSDRAMAGSPVQTAGNQQLTGTLQGDYLYGGPGFDAAFNAARRNITPQVQGQFEKAGRFGGGLAQEAETSALADAFAGLYGQERNRQMMGLGYVPQMAALDYTDIGALGQVGAQREAFEGQKLADELNRWRFEQEAPYRQLQAQSDVIQGGFPGGTMTSPYQGMNPLMGAVGGGMLGYSAGTAIGAGAGTAAGAGGGAAAGASTGSMAGPYGAIAGALLGALLASRS